MKTILLVIVTLVQSPSGNVLQHKTEMTVTKIPTLEECGRIAGQLNKAKNVVAECFVQVRP